MIPIPEKSSGGALVDWVPEGHHRKYTEPAAMSIRIAATPSAWAFDFARLCGSPTSMDSAYGGRSAPSTCCAAIWMRPATVYAGWSQAENGEAGEGAAMIRDGLARYRAVGAALSLPLYLGSLASVEAAAGKPRAALELLDEAQAASASGDEHWIAAEISRLAGEMLLAGAADTAGAERKFLAALAVAREQGAKLWELRAATSLARLWAEQDRRGEGRELLAPLYGWFTEGLGTADLQEAKALLAQLA
jgi:predicted ATPase